MLKGHQGRNPLRAFLVLVIGILAVSSAIIGPRMQAWYKTVPPKEAYAVGIGAFCAFVVLVYVVGFIIASRSTDA